jgi:hypothetical protein
VFFISKSKTPIPPLGHSRVRRITRTGVNLAYSWSILSRRRCDCLERYESGVLGVDRVDRLAASNAAPRTPGVTPRNVATALCVDLPLSFSLQLLWSLFLLVSSCPPQLSQN